MDVFSRTFHPAAADSGVTTALATRHLPIFRRCVEPEDSTLLVTRCALPDAPLPGDFLMLLTHRRLVVTRETRVLRRLRLHLNTTLSQLAHVAWSTDPRDGTMELSATAVDGVRERFRVRTAEPDHVWQLDALLKQVFTERRRNVSLAA
jgi:hypothetical protein